MSLTTFSPSTLIKSAEVNSNFSGLSDGSLDAIANSLQQFRDESLFDFVVSGLVWSGDAYASTKAASMTSGVVMINGRRILISAVTARTFTASKDTYIDILDNADGTGTLVYTEVTNNAASPALASNSIRIGIIVTGATNIAAAGSVNQGSTTAILPIASSIAYTVTDSLGNLICNRDPNTRTLGYRQITANLTTASTTAIQAVGLTCPVIVPTNRRVKITVYSRSFWNGTANDVAVTTIWDGVVASGTQLSTWIAPQNLGNGAIGMHAAAVIGPVSGAKTYNAGINSTVGGTTTLEAAATYPAYIKVELD